MQWNHNWWLCQLGDQHIRQGNYQTNQKIDHSLSWERSSKLKRNSTIWIHHLLWLRSRSWDLFQWWCSIYLSLWKSLQNHWEDHHPISQAFRKNWLQLYHYRRWKNPTLGSQIQGIRTCHYKCEMFWVKIFPIFILSSMIVIDQKVISFNRKKYGEIETLSSSIFLLIEVMFWQS